MTVLLVCVYGERQAMASYLGSVVGVWKPLRGMRTAAAQPCLDPRRRLLPPMSEDDAWSFCSSLSEDLRALERSLGEGSVSLRWAAEAVRVLKKTQADLLALFRRSRLPTSFGAKEGWFDLYMEETTVLLDLCNHLRSVTSCISRYRIVVDLVMHQIQKGSTPEFEALEAEHQKLTEATRQRETTKTPDDATTAPPEQIQCDTSATGVAMLAAKCATVAISMIIISAFTSPVSIDVEEEQITGEFPQLGPLAGSLASLVAHFRESCGGGPGVALAELELVRDSVGDLRRQLERGKSEDGVELGRSVELLGQRSVVLKEGIEMFDAAVDEVFDEMIEGRNELLDTFRDGALS